MLFEKLLVPLDGTAESAVALPIARAMARATGATVTLLRVLAADEADGITRAAQRELDGIAAELTAGGLTARTVVQAGDPAQTIVAHARMGEADLIVMRTHGRAGLARAVVGSVAERVLTQSPVPLLLLRPGDRYVSQIKSLLVPVDGSPGAALALGAASVADAVVRTARCPVLLERRAAPTVAHEAQQKSRGADLVPIGT